MAQFVKLIKSFVYISLVIIFFNTKFASAILLDTAADINNPGWRINCEGYHEARDFVCEYPADSGNSTQLIPNDPTYNNKGFWTKCQNQEPISVCDITFTAENNETIKSVWILAYYSGNAEAEINGKGSDDCFYFKVLSGNGWSYQEFLLSSDCTNITEVTIKLEYHTSDNFVALDQIYIDEVPTIPTTTTSTSTNPTSSDPSTTSSDQTSTEITSTFSPSTTSSDSSSISTYSSSSTTIPSSSTIVIFSTTPSTTTNDLTSTASAPTSIATDLTSTNGPTSSIPTSTTFSTSTTFITTSGLSTIITVPTSTITTTVSLPTTEQSEQTEGKSTTFLGSTTNTPESSPFSSSSTYATSTEYSSTTKSPTTISSTSKTTFTPSSIRTTNPSTTTDTLKPSNSESKDNNISSTLLVVLCSAIALLILCLFYQCCITCTKNHKKQKDVESISTNQEPYTTPYARFVNEPSSSGVPNINYSAATQQVPHSTVIFPEDYVQSTTKNISYNFNKKPELNARVTALDNDKRFVKVLPDSSRDSIESTTLSKKSSDPIYSHASLSSVYGYGLGQQYFPRLIRRN